MDTYSIFTWTPEYNYKWQYHAFLVLTGNDTVNRYFKHQ